MTPSDAFASPRLGALASELAGGRAGALAEFWEEIAEAGAPLVEPLEQDPSRSRVTFLWRDDSATRSVVVISQLGSGSHWNNYEESRMERLPATDVWHVTYQVMNDVRDVYAFSVNDPLIHPDRRTDTERYIQSWRRDPLNPKLYRHPAGEEDPGRPELIWSMLEMPDAAPQPWTMRRPGAAEGTLELEYLESDLLSNRRQIWTYTPAAYGQNTEALPLLLLLDGWHYATLIPTRTILDNLIAAREIPPVAAVLVGNAPGARLHELNSNLLFSRFVMEELLPRAEKKWKLVRDPCRRVIGGVSLGAVAAAGIALERPDVFGNVLAQSGAFWRGKPGVAEEEWVARSLALAPRLPLRFALEAGTLENARDSRYVSILRATRHLRDVLEAKGYPLSYAEFSGGHRAVSWRGTLSRGLIALFGPGTQV